MNNTAKQIEVQIMGQSYLLSVPEGGQARLKLAVERVDSAMCKIRDSGKIKARDRIAVLAALNLAYDLPAEYDGTRGAAGATGANPAAGPDAAAGAHDARIGSLIARIDALLSEDGRLI